jgi:hypothetical protein
LNVSSCLFQELKISETLFHSLDTQETLNFDYILYCLKNISKYLFI